MFHIKNISTFLIISDSKESLHDLLHLLPRSAGVHLRLHAAAAEFRSFPAPHPVLREDSRHDAGGAGVPGHLPGSGRVHQPLLLHLRRPYLHHHQQPPRRSHRGQCR